MKVTLAFVAEPEQVGFPLWTAPLTTPLLASCLTAAGHEVELLDTRLCEAPLADELAATSGDVVAISFMSHSRDEAFEVAALCREQGRITIGGGAHPTVLPGELVDSGLFDHVVRGEGERTLPRLVTDIERGRRPEEQVLQGEPFDLLDYPQPRDDAAYRDVYRPPSFVSTSRAASLTGLTAEAVAELASRDDGLVDVDALRGLSAERFPATREFRSIYLELGRGCPFHCRYCTIQNDWFAPKAGRARPLADVVAEVRYFVDRYDTNYVILVDSIAPAYPDFARFAEFMKTDLPDVEFSFNCTSTHFTPAVAEALAGANCLVWFGFETASPRLLRALRKPGNARTQLRATELCAEHGIRFGANLLLGVPGETTEDYELTMEFLAETRPHSPNPNILTPLPGTDTYRRCLDEGLLRDPGHYRSWTADQIRTRGHGPLLGVDYDRVLSYHRRMLELDRTGEVVHVERGCHLKPHE
ncbi:B12-binding domain-containing radical SAM protein [Saccharothrix sp. ALI-22-I]|uniref:B12-binding domain-containing radical SAM protein n=1 Tax=Saccharothrix sp. ALI-22-I TaxID=1933778 RepID=UPI00097C9646|nr:radical SAM protein [Saccharothrix sp. ALI-22-I]